MTDGPPEDLDLDATDAATGPGVRPATPAPPRPGSERYEAGPVIGRGGMGEVRRVLDRTIGRQVAVKTMHAGADEEARARFLREARVQGQLEHPAIVPVYDVGVGPDGTTFFTMRQLGGMTLATVLERLAAGDDAVADRFGRRRLLTDFVRAAQAVAYAHDKGVIHRDLKPSNLMFGDFGEVYVLDWGIAKVRDVAEAATLGGAGLRIGDASQTRDGSVLGTLGYMPPEQLEAAERVDARADVYALGAILFEVLAGQRLHEGTSVPELLASTTDGVDGRPSVRAPARDVPPELDAVCARATAPRADDRPDTVQALVDEVQRYLDGDRDLARRRALAQEHVATARACLADAAHDEHDARAVAMREAGRALAIDPHSEPAAALLSRLLLEPPRTIPPAVTERLEADDAVQSRLQARIGARSALGWLLLVPVLAAMGIRDAAAVVGLVVVMVFLVVASARMAASARPSIRRRQVIAGAVGIVIAWTSLIFGPLVLTPALAAMTVGMFMLERDDGDHRWLLVGGVGTVVLPWLAEPIGWLPRSLSVARDALVVHPRVVDFEPHLTVLMLLASSIAAIVVIGRTIATVTRASREARRTLALHPWHLDQLVAR